MSVNGRAIILVKKSHCYRTIVADVAPGKCGIEGNQCMMCYDQRFSRVREIHRENGDLESKFSLDMVRNQLSNPNLDINRKIVEDKVIRIGALGDITKGDRDNYNQYRLLFQMINAYGFHYILCTKSSHSIDEPLLEDMARHNALLQVTLGLYRKRATSNFERVDIIPPRNRRNLIKKSLSMGVETVLRLCPIHPSFMDEHVKVLQWFAGIGGTRVILETIRIMRNWMVRMPNVDFSRFVSPANGGVYNNYLTPPRSMQESIFKSMVEIGKINGIDKITICGDMESQDLLGAQIGDCCHASNHFLLPAPDRVWEHTDKEVQDAKV